MDVKTLARVCHQVNKALCEAFDDFSQPDWEMAEEWQKVSALNGVNFVLSGQCSPEAQHENWCAEKFANGWTYGAKKDPELKTHPCLVPYARLPPEQKAKDYVFGAIVKALTE